MDALRADTSADQSQVRHPHGDTDVLIIGAGLAGLSVALSLPSTLRITVLSKAELTQCSSFYAQGGIAACLHDDDRVSDHVADTLIAGAGLCDADNTAIILDKGKPSVAWLCAQGVPFTAVRPHADAAKPMPDLTTRDLHLTQEGGHGCRRVAHADDATGQHIMQTLTAKAKAAAHITILPYHEALTLLTAPLASHNEHQHCSGAVVFDHRAEQTFCIKSRAVVMASGGLGQLFKRASAPDVCIGDGMMMAWQAGCRLANLEFVQFHPTGLALADSSFLISEALRGEGAYLRCPITGKRFMPEIDARAELAPRDIVARAISAQIELNGIGYVHLDVSHLSADFLREHFPKIYHTLLDLGIDITVDPIPVAPIAHYSCGGIVTCADGLSDVIGLYAAGEVAYTGLHGANRLASNSLLECIVVGRNIALHLPQFLLDQRWTLPSLSDVTRISMPSQTAGVASHLIDFDKSSEHPSADIMVITAITIDLKALMSSHLGITRDAARLKHAMMQIEQWQVLIAPILPSPPVDFLGAMQHPACDDQMLDAYRLMRQLQLAQLVVQSAYQRCESLGGHFRQDYPNITNPPKISVIAPTDMADKYRSAPSQPPSQPTIAGKAVV